MANSLNLNSAHCYIFRNLLMIDSKIKIRKYIIPWIWLIWVRCLIKFLVYFHPVGYHQACIGGQIFIAYLLQRSSEKVTHVTSRAAAISTRGCTVSGWTLTNRGAYYYAPVTNTVFAWVFIIVTVAICEYNRATLEITFTHKFHYINLITTL